MASAGRILIMPKGNWDETIEYNMLDLVFHNGASWIGKKVSKGIEPTEGNEDCWMKMCEAPDVSDLERRISALESKI